MLNRPGTGTRPETGPMEFEGDWPGVFIRGDNAYGYITCLKGFLELHPETENESILEYNCRREIEQLIELLHSSNVPRDPNFPLKLPFQRMKGFVKALAPKRTTPKTQKTEVTEGAHPLTLTKLVDAYAGVESKNQRVVDLWMCEAHFDELRSIGTSHLQELVEDGEIRCKLWGARVHVSWTIPLNTFVALGSDDPELLLGVVTRESQLTRF